MKIVSQCLLTGWLTDIELESIKQRVLREEISHGESDLEREEEVESVRNVKQHEDTQTTDQPEETAEEGIRVERYEELREDEEEIVDSIIEITKAEEDYRVLPFKKVDGLKIN